MAVWALGINHHTAPLDLRGRFAFALDQIEPTLQGLRASLTSAGKAHNAVETAILSTCNRTEIYCAADAPAMDHTMHWLANSGGISSEAELLELKKMGTAAAILGKSLYTGALDLARCVQLVQE